MKRRFLHTLPLMAALAFATAPFIQATSIETIQKDTAVATQAATVLQQTLPPGGLSSDPATAFQQGINSANSVYMSIRPTLPPTAQTYGDLAVTFGVIFAGILGLFVHKSTIAHVTTTAAETHSELINSLDSSIPAPKTP